MLLMDGGGDDLHASSAFGARSFHPNSDTVLGSWYRVHATSPGALFAMPRGRMAALRGHPGSIGRLRMLGIEQTIDEPGLAKQQGSGGRHEIR
jgi:hypothetical protein